MKEVTDPGLLEKLEGKEVTDPEVLRQLEGRKTPKQMKSEMLPPLVSGKLGIHGPREARKEDPGSVLRAFSEAPYEAGGKVTDIGAKMGLPPQVSAGAGYLTNVGLDALMAFLPGGEAKAGVALKDVEKMTTLTEGRKLGLNVPPSMTGAGHVEKGIESIGGKADIGREMSSRNREAVQIAARKAAGVSENLPLNAENLAAARVPMYGPYNEIASVSPRAKEALRRMRQAREDAKGYWNEYNRNGTMTAKKEAQRLDDRAMAYEKLINFEATKAGRPDLLPALRQARVALAKNADVERALIPGSGDIDAKVLGRTLKKRGEGGMTGELQTIGKFAQTFPDFMQAKSVATDVSQLRPYLALGALGGGGALSEHYTGTPYGMALGALPFLSPAARALALSKAMQSGALGAGRSMERAGAASLIPLSQIGKDDDARP